MSEQRRRRGRVAVACQGGGSHTAFTAGVLDRLLAESDPAYEIVALTGTSGGGICAFLTWYGLASAADEASGRRRARELLRQVWDDVVANDPTTAVANRVGVLWAHARANGAPLPDVGPYDSRGSVWAEQYLRAALERAVPPEALARVVARQSKDGPGPTLHIGAVDVTRGTFRTFTERDVTIDAVLASAAIPTVFRAVTLDEGGEPRKYWDGLFSQNPPVHDLLAGVPKRRKPEEIWLIRINPQRRKGVPTTLEAIGNRRNELGGNLSVSQELGFIRRVNEWVAEGSLPDRYRPVAVRSIGLDENRLTPRRRLTAASKLDCRPWFVAELESVGRAAAAEFLTVERNRRLVRGTVDALWNTGSPAASVYLAEDFDLHVAADSDGRGPGVYERYVERFRSALDDLALRIEADVAEDDRVALMWRAEGRHVGRLFGVDPTGERVSVRGVEVARVETDESGTPTIAEAWVNTDDSGFVWALDAADVGEDVPIPETLPTPVVADTRTAEETRALAMDHAERLWGDGECDATNVLARDHVLRRAARDVEGREAYVAFVESYRDAFPDLRVSVRDVVAEGDRVVVRAAMTGCHRGAFEGIEGTGRRVEAHWVFLHEVTDGRIVATGMLDNHRWLLEQVSARSLSATRRSDAAGTDA